jgi:hypothetical protein
MPRLELTLPAELGPTGVDGSTRSHHRYDGPGEGSSEGEPRILRWLACWAGVRR